MNPHLRRNQHQASVVVPAALSRRAAVGRFGAGVALGLGLLHRVQGAGAQESTPMAEAPPFLDTWLTVWNEDPSQADAVYTEDVVLADVPAGATYEGRDAIQAHAAEFLAGFSDLSFEVRSAFAAGEMAAVEFVATGTYSGALPGLPPGTGQNVTVFEVAIFELEGDRIRRESHYYDAYALLIQLGALPAPGAEGTPAP